MEKIISTKILETDKKYPFQQHYYVVLTMQINCKGDFFQCFLDKFLSSTYRTFDKFIGEAMYIIELITKLVSEFKCLLHSGLSHFIIAMFLDS